jgi:RNA polymerase subunit RPABC4/transcription elongation factor Spt4
MNPILPLITVALVAALVLMIPIFMGVYVYRDAKARGMDALLWALVAVLVPSFVGLIIYLVIRGNNPNRDCPNCRKPVSSEYALCPYCGAHLKAACAACGTSVEAGWKLCPHCGAALPETQSAPDAPAEPKRDRKLLGIIAAAVLIPIVLFVLGITALGLWNANSRVEGGMMSFGINQIIEDAPAHVREWVAACDAQGKGAYVLKLAGQGEDVYAAYIYLNPYKGENGGMGYWGEADVLPEERAAEVRYGVTTGNTPGMVPDYELSELRSQGYDVEGLRIYIDGEAVEAVVSEGRE